MQEFEEAAFKLVNQPREVSLQLKALLRQPLMLHAADENLKMSNFFKKN